MISIRLFCSLLLSAVILFTPGWAQKSPVAALQAVSAGAAQPSHSLTTEEQAAIAPLQTLMEGLARRDTQMVGSVFLPGGMVTLLRAGKPLQLQSNTFVTWIEGRMKAAPGKLEESLHDPVVHVDHDLASVWAPYTFKLDGKVDHCGTDVATMVQQNGLWLIASLEDNSRKDCVVP